MLCFSDLYIAPYIDMLAWTSRILIRQNMLVFFGPNSIHSWFGIIILLGRSLSFWWSAYSSITCWSSYCSLSLLPVCSSTSYNLRWVSMIKCTLELWLYRTPLGQRTASRCQDNPFVWMIERRFTVREHWRWPAAEIFVPGNSVCNFVHVRGKVQSEQEYNGRHVPSNSMIKTIHDLYDDLGDKKENYCKKNTANLNTPSIQLTWKLLPKMLDVLRFTVSMVYCSFSAHVWGTHVLYVYVHLASNSVR